MDCAHGLTLGDIEPLSALGQPFRARVPYRLADGESLDAQCLHLPGRRMETSPGLPEIVNVVPRVESLEGGGYIVLQTAEKTTEPAFQLTLEVRCEKTDKLTRQYVLRQYLLLLDPPDRFSQPSAAPATVVGIPPPQRTGGAASPVATTTIIAAPTSAPAPRTVVSSASPLAAPRTAAPAIVAASPQATGAHPPAPALGGEPERKPGAKRDLLRLTPTIVEPERNADQKLCCFRLDYELREREGMSVTEAERELLRREFAERMAEGDMWSRLFSLRDQFAALKGQILAKQSERAAILARHELEAQSERDAWLIAFVLGASSLGVGAWLWLRRPQHSPFDTDSFYDNGPQPVTRSSAVDAVNLVGAPDKESGPVAASGRLQNREAVGEVKSGNLFASKPVESASTQAASAPLQWQSTDETLSAAWAAGGELDALQLPKPADRSDLAGGDPRGATTHQETQSPATGITFDLGSDEEASAAPAVDLVLDSTPGNGLDVDLDWLTASDDEQVAASQGSAGGAKSAPGSGQARGDNTGHFADLMGGGFSSVSGLPTLELADGSDAGKPEAAQRAQQYREAYFEERFPEIAAGSIVLSNSASVVEGARIMYQEDQDFARAVELLQLAWSSYREHLGLWLCLFEIYWLEGMRAPFIDLARRFQEEFSPKHKDWPMIARLGRELDATNIMFRADGLSAVQEGTPNWLNAELDMMGQVLSREMRDQVLKNAEPSTPGAEPGQKH